MITGTIDTSRAVRALESLHDAMIGKGMDCSNLLKDETRLLCRTIVNFTPPLKGGAGSPQRSGEAAIAREVGGLFSEASQHLIDEIGSRYGIRDVDAAYVTEKNGTRLQLQWQHIDSTGDRMAEYHQQY